MGWPLRQGFERREFVPRAHGILLASSRKWLPFLITDPVLEPPILLSQISRVCKSDFQLRICPTPCCLLLLCASKAHCMSNASQNFQSGCPPHFSLSDKFYPAARPSSRGWKAGIAFVRKLFDWFSSRPGVQLFMTKGIQSHK